MKLYTEDLDKIFAENGLLPILENVPRYYLQASSIDRRLVEKVPLQGKNLLNIGCGSHLVSDVYFALKGASVTSVDIDEGSINAAKEKLSQVNIKNNIIKIKVMTMDGRDLSFADNTFDIVVSFSAIEHMNNYNDRLKSIMEMSRVVKPKGHIVVTGPNFLNLPTTFLSKRTFKKMGEFEHRYTPWELKNMLTKCALKIEEFDAESVYIIDKDLINSRFPSVSIVPPILLKPLSLLLYGFNRLRLLKPLGMRMGFRAGKI